MVTESALSAASVVPSEVTVLLEIRSPSLVVTEVAALTSLTEVTVLLDVRSPSLVVTDVAALNAASVVP